MYLRCLRDPRGHQLVAVGRDVRSAAVEVLLCLLVHAVEPVRVNVLCASERAEACFTEAFGDVVGLVFRGG